MAWWSSRKPEEVDESGPAPVRLASAEFVSGLVEVAEQFELREKDARERVVSIATDLSRKEYFNHGDLDRMMDGIRGALLNAHHYRARAGEVRDWIRSYEHCGRRPPYMPPAPPQPADPNRGGGE